MACTKKTIHKGFSYRNCDDFAAYLNHMARLGWHFREWRAGLVFEQGEPEDSVYAVEVFSGAGEYDTRPEPQTKEFAEYCEAAGWQLIDARRKFVVFKRIRPDAVPIMTDKERFESIAKAEKYGIWYPLIFSAVWFAMKLFEFHSMFPYRIFSPTDLFLLAVWGALLILALFRGVGFLLWKRRCRRRMEQGLSLFFGRTTEHWNHWLQSLVHILLMAYLVHIGMGAAVLILLIIEVPMVVTAYIIAKRRPDSGTNELVQILLPIGILVLLLCTIPFLPDNVEWKNPYVIDPPLTYADIGIELPQRDVHYSWKQESILGNKQYANLDYGNEYLYYSLYTTDNDWVLNKLWTEETKGKANETRVDCTEAWGALEAFRNGAGNYIVRYADALWVISPSLEEPLTQQQIDAVIAAIRGE